MKVVGFFFLIVSAWVTGALIVKGLGLNRHRITVTIEQQSDAVAIPRPTHRWRI